MIMLNSKYLKTYRYNTDSDEIATPDDSHVIRFCIHTMNTYAPVIDKLSEAFLSAQLAFQEGYSKGPKKICILVSSRLTEYKFKPEDPETSFERIEWFIQNFKKPAGGVIVSFYASSEHDIHLDSHWSLTKLWQTEKTWNSRDVGDYVTVHLPEASSNVTWNKQNFYPIWNNIEEDILDRGLEIKYVSYTTPYQELYDLMIRSRLHLSYVGASYIFAGITKTPTLGLGVDRGKNAESHYIVDGLPFYYSGYPKNIWGTGPMQEDRVMQIDDDMKVKNDYVHHVVETAQQTKADEYVHQVLGGDYSSFSEPKKPQATIGTDPWFYIAVDDFLPTEQFENLRDDALRIAADGDQVQRQIFNHDPTPQIESFIRTFLKAQSTSGVRIRPHRELKKFIHYAVTPANFNHAMHVEAEFKIMSAVLYLGPEENIGTRLYKSPEDQNPIEVEWVPNRLFVFCGHDHTWHDYASTNTRYTYNYFLVDPHVVQNAEYKDNLI